VLVRVVKCDERKEFSMLSVYFYIVYLLYEHYRCKLNNYRGVWSVKIYVCINVAFVACFEYVGI